MCNFNPLVQSSLTLMRSLEDFLLCGKEIKDIFLIGENRDSEVLERK